MKKYVRAGLAGAALAALTAGCGSTVAQATSSKHGSSSSSSSSSKVLTLRVSAGSGASITYTDPTDGTIQQITAGHWSKSWKIINAGTLGVFEQLSVQNGTNTTMRNANAPVSCKILYGGKVKDSHRTTGYNVASCQYQLGGD